MFIYLTLLSGYSPLVKGNCVLSGTCQKLAGGEGGGGWKQREGHNFLRLRKREGA